MPYIKVNTDKIKSYTTELESSRIAFNNMRQSCTNLRNALDWDVRSSSGIEKTMDRISDDLYDGATHLTNMREYLNQAVRVYDGQSNIINDVAKTAVMGGVLGALAVIQTDADTLCDLADKFQLVYDVMVRKDIQMVIKEGKVFLKGYIQGTGFTSRYNYETWVAKNSEISLLSKIAAGIEIADHLIDMGSNLVDVWNDENKTTEKKVCDTVANVGCTAGAIGATVAGTILGAKLGGAIGSAIPIPVVGTVVGAVVGAGVGFVAGKVAEAFKSEEVINQVSDSVENVVGAVKAGAQAVSDKAKEFAEAEGIAKVGKAVEVVTTTVSKAAEVVKTAVVESVKTVGKVIKNVFKGW